MTKKIWLLWIQGISDAPYIVKACYQSWLEKNPGWEVVILDENTLTDYLGQDFSLHKNTGNNLASASDIIRVNLLAKYGGVWVDATCLCMQPLDEWLFNNAESELDFFAFSRPTKDKLISSWFLASEKDGKFITRLKEETNGYWQDNDFSFYQSNIILKVIGKLFQNRTTLDYLSGRFNRNVKTTRHWFSFVIRRVFNVYPYFWLHYLANKLIEDDASCKKIWEAMPKISADLPHSLQHIGLEKPVTSELKQKIDDLESPVYKLNWRTKEDQSNERVIDYILTS